jgi:7-cyano-7-deazaguanine synthase
VVPLLSATDRKNPVLMTKAVVLLSGGLDSATCLAAALAEGRVCTALSVRYGQRHAAELDAAARLAARHDVDHVVVGVDLRAIGGSALTDNIDVPHGDGGDAGSSAEMVDDVVVDERFVDDRFVAVESPDDIPVTYVPARNTVLLALALGVAEVRSADEIWIGVNAVDYSGYPDCRPGFIDAFQSVADVATKAAVTGGGPPLIRTPLIDMTKAQIITLGHELGVDFAGTLSCYDPVGAAACGTCDACRIRLAGFAAAGVTDPATYVPGFTGDEGFAAGEGLTGGGGTANVNAGRDGS